MRVAHIHDERYIVIETFCFVSYLNLTTLTIFSYIDQNMIYYDSYGISI